MNQNVFLLINSLFSHLEHVIIVVHSTQENKSIIPLTGRKNRISIPTNRWGVYDSKTNQKFGVRTKKLCIFRKPVYRS
uniref:Uncharacterized protein n=1 Tax=Lepeophtheirus salmonis TaxID=72036 RepID=A0A0K2T7T3_LEPSM